VYFLEIYEVIEKISKSKIYKYIYHCSLGN
jgi:hypothetical protein